MILLHPTSIAAGVVGILIIFLLIAVWTDIKSHRISNNLILTGIIIGILTNTFLPHGNGFISNLLGALGFVKSVIGLFTGFALLAPLYILRGMGAGDVKLVAMIGAFSGASTVISIVLMTFVIGGVLSIIFALYSRSFAQLIANLWTMIIGGHFKLALKGVPTLDAPVLSAGKLPYAIPIALGTFSYLYLIHLYPNLNEIF
jgi:prepilin peptidase CpaA